MGGRTENLMLFRFGSSHIYPGAVAMLEDDEKTGMDAVISFSDDAYAIARRWRDGASIIIDVPTYRTAKGTDIKPRVWRLDSRGNDKWRAAPVADRAVLTSD